MTHISLATLSPQQSSLGPLITAGLMVLASPDRSHSDPLTILVSILLTPELMGAGEVTVGCTTASHLPKCHSSLR